MNALRLDRKRWIKRIQDCAGCIVGVTFIMVLGPILLISLRFYVSGNRTVQGRVFATRYSGNTSLSQ